MKPAFLLAFLFGAIAGLPAQTEPSRPPAPEKTSPVIAAQLKGVRLGSDPAAPAGAAEGIDLSGAPWLESGGLRTALGARLGRPLSFADIDAMIREIKTASAGAGRPFINVLVPAQDITRGVLTLVVLEGKIGQIKIEGEKWFSEASYRAALHLVPGQTIARDRLNADLDWLGRSGYRRATVEAAPGERVGLTDLTVQVEEQRPWRFHAGYSDTGTATTDDERIMAGVAWGNAFGRGEELSYQLVTSPDLKTSVSHSGSYTVPIDRWHHVFRVDAAWSTIRADIPAPFDSKGYSWQVGLNYEIPLHDFQMGPAVAGTHSFTAGFDVKETNNNIEFSNIPVTDNTTQILQFRANYQVSLEDKSGRTSASLTGVFSPGGLSANNKDAAFNGSRSGAQADYAYLNLSLRRDTKLPHGFAHVISFTGQIASANLLGSEQLGLGGAQSVRGYDEGLVYGDQGALLRNELYLPAFSLTAKLAKNLPRDSVRLLGFWDYGVVGGKHLLKDEDPNLILSSVGVGLRYQLGEHFSAQFDYGWQQKDPGFPTREAHGRGHVNVNYTW